MVALRRVAAHLPEARELVGVLDPLGEHLQAHRAPEADHRRDDRLVAEVPSEPVDKGPVPIGDADGEPLEVGDGSVTGARVLDREPPPEDLQLLKPRDRRPTILHDDALRDLEAQVARIEVGLPKDLRDARDEIGLT